MKRGEIMNNKKRSTLSVIALTASLVPLLTFVEVLFKLETSYLVQSIWAGINIVSVIIGLGLSIICVKDKSSRSLVNITALIISSVWVLNIFGILAIALLVTFS